jgi:hypothetical protein
MVNQDWGELWMKSSQERDHEGRERNAFNKFNVL